MNTILCIVQKPFHIAEFYKDSFCDASATVFVDRRLITTKNIFKI